MTFSRARSEQGFALVTAIIVMGIMMTLGLAIFAYSDGQTVQTRFERVNESSFNLAERALEQQTFKLSRAWAGSAATAYPASCTSAVPADLCPNSTELISAGDSPDADAATTWSTIVRDNGDNLEATNNTGEDFYSPALVDGRPSWDENGDGVVWVKAKATVRGKTRTLVAKVRVESIALPFPKTSLIANTLVLGNEGNKKIVDTDGPSDGAIGPVLLRCAEATPEQCVLRSNGSAYSPPYDPGSDPRVSPGSFGRPAPDSIVGVETTAQLRDTAQANGTLYESCPTDAQLTGDVVYITSAVGDCSYNINGSINSPDRAGIIVVESSNTRFELRGNLQFYGLMYFMNALPGPPADKIVLELDGTITIHGAIAVEGDGSVKVGSSGAGGQGEPNVSFDESVFGPLKAYGTAGILQNSWRDLRQP